MDSLLVLTSFLGLAASIVLIIVGAQLLRKAISAKKTSISSAVKVKPTPQSSQSFSELLRKTEGKLEGES